jgi:hypothetical protein
VRSIFRSEGLAGFGKGFSACFYGSVFCGITYFSLYKLFKLKLYEILGDDCNPTYIFLLGSIIAEVFTIIVHFPFDLIKCRLQTKNFQFRYKNLPHAFRKEIRNNGFKALY